ncbi:MAG: hypothetical protein IT454_02275 [Planctomycetes bacterium]|nr:hypothetical protein [Planctomycetota bacterium]
MEDALDAGMFGVDPLTAKRWLWRSARESIERRSPASMDLSASDRFRMKRVANEMLEICIDDRIIASAEDVPAEFGFES